MHACMHVWMHWKYDNGLISVFNFLGYGSLRRRKYVSWSWFLCDLIAHDLDCDIGYLWVSWLRDINVIQMDTVPLVPLVATHDGGRERGGDEVVAKYTEE